MVTFIVSLTLFMENLDITIINTAIPVMSHSLQVNPIDLKIALISYLVSLAIFIPISGWTGDKFGVKRVFIVALFIFIMSSLWCGYARNLTELILARTLQGIGGALMMPLGRLILFRHFPRHEIITIMSYVAMIGALGILLGPVLGGIITYYFSWGWIFWMNVPVGLLAIFMAQCWITEISPQPVPPLDKIGFILFGVSLASFTFGLSAFSENTLPFSVVLLTLAGGIFLLIIYIGYSYNRPHPIINTKLFQSRSFNISMIGNLISRLGFAGVPFLLPLLLQIGIGYSSKKTGFLLAPWAVGIFLVRPFSLALLRIFGYRKLLVLNTLVLGLSIWSFILITSHSSIYFICVLTCLFGLLTSIQYSSMNSLAYADVTTDQLSSATSIISIAQQLTQSFGIAISALLIHWFSLDSSLHFLLTATVFYHTLFIMGILTLFSSIVFMCLKSEDGYQMFKEKTSHSLPLVDAD